jgi:UDP:flavonoid glycosyltransferase YjiC (YdhE family)
MLLTVGNQNEIDIAKEVQRKYMPFLANIEITANVPMSAAFNMADLVIHHGGYGSCFGQIIYEKASMMVPTNSEREYTARMLENLGLGISIPLGKMNTSIFRDSVYHLLNDKSYTNCAIKYNKLLKEREYQSAGDFIERIIR